jgi:hypothetical protein
MNHSLLAFIKPVTPHARLLDTVMVGRQFCCFGGSHPSHTVLQENNFYAMADSEVCSCSYIIIFLLQKADVLGIITNK